MKTFKELVLNSKFLLVRIIGKRLYSLFLKIVNGPVGRFYAYKPYMNDEKYIREIYTKRLGVAPSLDKPVNFNEKNNWRKLHDRNPQYTEMVDKYRLKCVVKEKCGEGYTVPLIGVWDRPSEIDFATLPNKFVLKANHASGVIVCRDKTNFDFKTTRAELRNEQKYSSFYSSREWPYKNVKRKIIAEAYMGENLIDYKNYCFNGKMLYTFVWKNKSRTDGRKPGAFFCGAFDNEWSITGIEIDYPSIDEAVERPDCYDEMKTIAEKMSENIPFVRVDCYIIDSHIYVGEMTFFPWGGFEKFKGEYWNNHLGELEKLPTDDNRKCGAC